MFDYHFDTKLKLYSVFFLFWELLTTIFFGLNMPFRLWRFWVLFLELLFLLCLTSFSVSKTTLIKIIVISDLFVINKILVPLHAELLHLVRDHVHYIPTEWLKDPRSSKSQKYFSQLFQVC